MSKAPSVMTEYSLAVVSRSNSSLLMCIGPSAALALTWETSLVGLYVLIVSSMCRISSSTASIACVGLRLVVGPQLHGDPRAHDAVGDPAHPLGVRRNGSGQSEHASAGLISTVAVIAFVFMSPA